MLEVEFVPHRQVTGLLCCSYMLIGHLSKLAFGNEFYSNPFNMVSELGLTGGCGFEPPLRNSHVCSLFACLEV